MSKTKKQASSQSLKKANLAVIIVVSIAAAIIIAIAVLSAVRINPVKDFEEPERYSLYDIGSDNVQATNGEAQNNIKIALGDMKFSIMTGILQWKWDYSLNFKRNAKGEKIEVSSDSVKNNTERGENEYTVELVYADAPVVDGAIDYSKAHKISVDGETVYFDRVKIYIGNSEGKVGLISIYPYLSARIDNESDIDGIASDTYKVTGINVRADTTRAYTALGNIVKSVNE